MRWWCPPDPLAFTAAEVADALTAGANRCPSDAFFGRPTGELTGPARAPTLERLQIIAEKATTVPIGFVSFARVLEYPAGGGGLPWHRDRLDDDRHVPPELLEEAEDRVLSCTVQLSRPDDYEGGLLDVRGTDGVETAPREIGTVVFFPATTVHRVTPVTAGRRLSLVAFWSAP